MKGARLKRLRTMCFPLCDILEKTKLRGENACQWLLVTEMEGAWLESGKRKVGRGNVRHLDCGGDFMTVFVVKIHKRGILPYGNFISLKKKKKKKTPTKFLHWFCKICPLPQDLSGLHQAVHRAHSLPLSDSWSKPSLSEGSSLASSPPQYFYHHRCAQDLLFVCL